MSGLRQNCGSASRTPAVRDPGVRDLAVDSGPGGSCDGVGRRRSRQRWGYQIQSRTRTGNPPHAAGRASRTRRATQRDG